MNQYQPKKMLVTGGAGFIGSHFIRHTLKSSPNITIINLDKLTYAGSLNNLADLTYNARHHFVQGDITDRKLVDSLLQHHSIDTIVHFAAESHVDRSIAGPAAFIETNIIGTFTLLEAARQYWNSFSSSECRFHHISTDEVFGSLEPHDPMFTENTRYAPRSPYSASKASSDHLVYAYHHTYGLPITLTNCSNNYGPYQHSEKFIPTVIQSCLNKKTIPIYGNGKNIRDWLYVEDHCAAIAKVIDHGRIGESYNIGGNTELENLTLARMICSLLDEIHPASQPYESLLRFISDRPGHDLRYAIDMQKMNTELNWQPVETLESGLRKTIAFYMDVTTLEGRFSQIKVKS